MPYSVEMYQSVSVIPTKEKISTNFLTLRL